MAKIALEMVPDSRHQPNVAALPVADGEPGENAQNPKVPLRARNRKLRFDKLHFGPGRLRETHDEFAPEQIGNISPSVFKERNEVVGAVADRAILIIEKSDALEAVPFGKPDDVLCMEIAMNEQARRAHSGDQTFDDAFEFRTQVCRWFGPGRVRQIPVDRERSEFRLHLGGMLRKRT